MIMNDTTYAYDAAFSFLSEDEPLALKPAELLKGRYSVFVYSERQKELAGRDGVEEFSAVFSSRARVSIVLHRAGWGATKWTRIEETAIKERALESGWDFLLVVALDNTPPPVWLPRTKLWLGFERFGLDALIGAIDARVQEAGGAPREETARVRAERLRLEREREAERRQVLNSQRGVDLARTELDELQQYLEAEAPAISASGTPIQFVRARPDRFYIGSDRASVTFGWAQQWSNSVEYASLLLRTLDGPYHHDGWGGGPEEIDSVRARFDLDGIGQPVWVEERSEVLLSTRALGEKYLKVLLELTLTDDGRGLHG
jgi:hypothetical protein